MHVACTDGEIKLWLEPEVEVARNHGLSSEQLTELLRVVEERRDEIIERWRNHFSG